MAWMKWSGWSRWCRWSGVGGVDGVDGVEWSRVYGVDIKVCLVSFFFILVFRYV